MRQVVSGSTEAFDNPIVTLTGLGSLVMAPFGAHAFNVAAITAAICTNKDAREDPSKRYIAGLVCGLLYVTVGIFGVTLANAMAEARTRETALITFLATSANVPLLGVGGAFWGLVAGLVVHLLIHGGRKTLKATAYAR
ncbi:Inner membrane protein YdcO [compost metagenome]|jgi:benzoate membrane transport protein